MPHLVEHKRPVPLDCEECAHYIEGCKCKAFDIIPIELFYAAEEHCKKIEGQKGNFVFEAKEGTERHYTIVYVLE